MAGVVGKISCSKVRDLLRFPDFDDSNYLEKRKALVLHYTITRDDQPGDLALHRHQWATLIFSSNEGQSLHRRSGWDLKAPVLVVPRVALARLAMENEKTKSRQPSNPISNPPRKGLRSKTELYQLPDPPQAPSPPRSTYPT